MKLRHLIPALLATWYLVIPTDPNGVMSRRDVFGSYASKQACEEVREDRIENASRLQQKLIQNTGMFGSAGPAPLCLPEDDQRLSH